MEDQEKEGKETQVETPTPEQELEMLRKEATEAKALAEEKVKGFKTIQQQLSEEQTKSRQLNELLSDREADRELQKAIIALNAEERGQTEEGYGENLEKKKPDLLKKYNELEERSKTQRQARQYNQQADAQWTRIEGLGLTKEDDTYWDVMNYLKTGQIDRAQVVLNKLERTKAEPAQGKESEEAKVERLVEEKARKMLEEKGLLTSETGKPSTGGAGTLTAEKVAGMSPKERFERRAEIANLPL